MKDHTYRFLSILKKDYPRSLWISLLKKRAAARKVLSLNGFL